MLTKLRTLLLASAALCAAEPFRLTSVLVTSQTQQTHTVFISTTGELPTQMDFANRKLWSLIVAEKTNSTEKQLDLESVTWDSKTRRFTVTFDQADLAGLDLRKLDWTVTFNNRYQASAAATNPNSFFSSAKSKDDADLYFSGSYLAGFGTKPLYSIDAKLNWVPEMRESGYFFGVESAILVNSGVTAPVDRTRIDPDSVSAALSLQHGLGDFAFDINPVRGEFSRKFPASDIITAGTLRWVTTPLVVKRTAFVFYPLAGYEVGSNLNKPALLFKEPVNLSGYNTIARGIVGAHTALLFFKKSPAPDSPYRFSIQADYTARVLFAPEPFVTSGYIEGVRQDLTSVRSNTRHYLETGVVYNLNDLLALEIKYRYGSLPPLFEFVNHQVTVGIAFKSKLPHTLRNGM